MKHTKRIATLCLALALAAGLVGCQPTPERQAVVQKNTGAFESAAAVSAAKPYEAPARYESELMGADGVSIRFAADVELPGLERYPVYSARPVPFTQAQVDNVLNVLLDGETLYENNTEQRSKDEIQYDIDYYTWELEACGDDPEFADSVVTYRQWLKDFMIEYENAPEKLDLTEAERKLQFNENDGELVWSYGKEEPEFEGGAMQFVWTEEGKRQAAADGNECVTGVFWKEFGGKRVKMQFLAANRAEGMFGRPEAVLRYESYAGTSETVTDLAQEEAEQIARQMLEEMKIDAEWQETRREALLDWSEVDGETTTDPVDKGTAYYEVTFVHRVPGTVQKSMIPARWMSEPDASYIYPVPNERITLCVGGDGVTKFTWSSPIEVSVVENENTPLLPLEEIGARAEAQLKNLSAGLSFLSGGDSDSQRIQADQFMLSYLMTQKPDSTDEYYFIPVWDVCGNVFYHYPDDYPSNTSNHYVLDENWERPEYNTNELWGNTPVSLVTINAIDGSVIERGW